MKIAFIISAAAIILMVLTGCEAAIGDKCSTSNDCPSGMVCDTDSPGGYCLVPNCESNEECPDDGTCVSFTNHIAFCLKKCSKNSDCRGGEYMCRNDIGTDNFCYVSPDDSYGRDENNLISTSASNSEN